MFTVPAGWQKILSRVQQKDRTAVLAGGCLRDLWCGKPHRDLDIFVSKDFQFGTDVRSRSTHPAYQSQLRNHIISVYVADYMGQEVNVIHVRGNLLLEPIRLIRNFDYGICQIAWDGKEFITTPAFQTDYKYKRFTMVDGRSYERSKARWETKLRMRYIGWQMIMSEKAVAQATRIKFGIQEKREHESEED